MATYLTFDLLKGLITIPDEFVNEVEARYPGWVEAQIAAYSRWVEAQLRKRYATPFNAYDGVPDPTPPQIQFWLARLVAVPVWLKRGVDPNDLQFEEVRTDRDNAREEIADAANSETGLYDLPLKVSKDGSLIVHGGPFSYSEQSPYVAFDRQRVTGRNEDNSGSGTGG